MYRQSQNTMWIFLSLSFSLFLCFVMHVYLLNVLNPHNVWLRVITLNIYKYECKKNLKLGSVFLFKKLSSIHMTRMYISTKTSPHFIPGFCVYSFDWFHWFLSYCIQLDEYKFG